MTPSAVSSGMLGRGRSVQTRDSNELTDRISVGDEQTAVLDEA